jgi:hypothetical protein
VSLNKMKIKVNTYKVRFLQGSLCLILRYIIVEIMESS